MLRLTPFVVVILILPLAHGMLWENYESHTIFSTTQWVKVENQRYNISAGQDLWALWSERRVIIYEGYRPIENMTCGHLVGMWIGGGHILLKFSNGTSLISSIYSSERIWIHYNVNQAYLLEFGAVVLADSTYFIDFKNSTIESFDGYEFGLADGYNNKFLLFHDGTLVVIGNESRRKITFKNEIVGVGATEENYYVLCHGTLYILDEGYRVVAELKTDANHIYSSRHFVAMEEEIIDDEGMRQWLFFIVGYEMRNATLLGRHVAYIPPRSPGGFGDYIAFYDSKMIHIMDEKNHICSNNTFERIKFSNSMIVAYNSSGIYAMSYRDFSSTLKSLGGDNDLDWIPDSKDDDDDNDGMPDWWEEKYGLNPLDASDRNLDPDNDGLTNYQEFLYGTDPLNPDTDGDGLSDGYEVYHGLNPLNPQSSGAMNTYLVEYVILSFLLILFLIGLEQRKRWKLGNI